MGVKLSKVMARDMDLVPKRSSRSVATSSFISARSFQTTGLLHYKLGRRLGVGRFGEVYHARDMRNNEDVAIKLLRRGPQLNPNYVAREILNHQELSHPHIIEFREVFLTDTHLCIVMEYAAGGCLRDYLVNHRFISEHRARWLFQQLMLAVDFCHKKNIVIRDIKLSNILLNERQDHIMLCDFGFSKSAKRDSPTTTFLGTGGYIPPELLVKLARKGRVEKTLYDAEKVDMWSCGVTLYTMLVGRNPFYGPGEEHLSKSKISFARMLAFKRDMQKGCVIKNPPQELSPECCDFLVKILDPNPENRMSLQECKDHPWFKVNLPPNFSEFNDFLISQTKDVESAMEVEIRDLVQSAQTPYSNYVVYE